MAFRIFKCLVLIAFYLRSTTCPSLPDIFLTKNASYSELATDCDTIELDGRKIRIASKPKIIDMKKKVDPIRAKDQFDIEELTKLISKEENSG